MSGTFRAHAWRIPRRGPWRQSPRDGMGKLFPSNDGGQEKRTHPVRRCGRMGRRNITSGTSFASGRGRRCPMKYFLMCLAILVVVLAATAAAFAGPGDPRLVNGVLEWPRAVTNEPFLIVRGDDGGVYYVTITTARRGATLTAGARVAVLGLEGRTAHEINALGVGAGDSVESALASLQGASSGPAASTPAVIAPSVAAPTARSAAPPAAAESAPAHGGTATLAAPTVKAPGAPAPTATAPAPTMTAPASTVTTPTAPTPTVATPTPAIVTTTPNHAAPAPPNGTTPAVPNGIGPAAPNTAAPAPNGTAPAPAVTPTPPLGGPYPSIISAPSPAPVRAAAVPPPPKRP